MRTQEEILRKVRSISPIDDFFGTIRSDLVMYLEYDNAKEYLQKGVERNKWNECFKKPTKKNIVSNIKGYMEFAWDKANNCRGLSANRSINHMEAWLWLLGDEKLQVEFDKTAYEHYGKEKLIVVCKHLKIDWKKYDNGERMNCG